MNFEQRRRFFSRDEWRERGRIVCVDNSEAMGVDNFFRPDRRGIAGARHVFSWEQTLPITEQLVADEVAA